jgi:predicted membrane channel-forming protein YqfA (hemolysin III family)
MNPLTSSDMRFMFMTVAGVMSILGFILALIPEFSKVEYKWLRCVLFITLSFSVGAPLFYLSFF